MVRSREESEYRTGGRGAEIVGGVVEGDGYLCDTWHSVYGCVGINV